MSRVGKLPIAVPAKVKVAIAGNKVSVEGPGGKLQRTLSPEVTVALEAGQVTVKRVSESRTARQLHGLSRTLVANMINGVSTGFSKQLEVIGVGYRVELKGGYLVFALGYSHPILFELPKDVTAAVEANVKITLKSANKELLGQTAATIRSLRPPEPYKGKGIKYTTEVIKQKVGKAGTAK